MDQTEMQFRSESMEGGEHAAPSLRRKMSVVRPRGEMQCVRVTYKTQCSLENAAGSAMLVVPFLRLCGQLGVRSGVP